MSAKEDREGEREKGKKGGRCYPESRRRASFLQLLLKGAVLILASPPFVPRTSFLLIYPALVYSQVQHIQKSYITYRMYAIHVYRHKNESSSLLCATTDQEEARREAAPAGEHSLH